MDLPHKTLHATFFYFNVFNSQHSCPFFYCTPPFYLFHFTSNSKIITSAEILIFLSSYNLCVTVLLSDIDLRKLLGFFFLSLKHMETLDCCPQKKILNILNADITLAYLGKLSIWGLMLSGGVYYYVHCSLSRDGRTQANRQHFEKLGLDLWIHVQHLHVASTETAPKYRQEHSKGNKRSASVQRAHAQQEGVMALPFSLGSFVTEAP